MLRSILRRIFWKRCSRHEISYDSDFCPGCMRERTMDVADRATEPGIVNSLTVRRVLAAEESSIRTAAADAVAHINLP